MLTLCHICGKPIMLWWSENYEHFFEGKPVHKECYFEKLGEFIEENPIGGFGTRG